MKIRFSILSSIKAQLLFWIPAAMHLAIICSGIVIIWFALDPLIALSIGLLAAVLVIILQLRYLYGLSHWLNRPDIRRLPDGWGVWGDIFSRLYRLCRADEKSRAELSEWLTRFRQAMSLLPDGVAIVDNMFCLEWCNATAQEHLGLDNIRDQGQRITNLVRHPAFIDYLAAGRYTQPLNVVFNERSLIVRIISFEQHRQILVTHDMTEARRIETMSRDFIANASHELRTPLTVINGFLEIANLQPDLDLATRHQHVKLMAEQGQRMQNLVTDMLTLTRLESIDFPPRAEVVQIAALLEQLLQESRALSAGKHTITLSINASDIQGSTEELHSAFGNLVFNAVRYTPEKGRIDMSWCDTEAGPRFSVQDDGIGISPEHIDRLTERFYRVDKNRLLEGCGTGLGLAIVKHVLLRHDAVLKVTSTPGKGSTFIAQFPVSSRALENTAFSPDH